MSHEDISHLRQKGVEVKLLASVALGPEIQGMAGCQLRMRNWASSSNLAASSARFTTTKADQVLLHIARNNH